MAGMDERLDGWMDGLIGGHSARCEIFSGVSPYVFSERATWSTRMCPHQCSQVGSLPGQKVPPINVSKCAQVFHNGQINFTMCAKNSIHAN
jgi:hypothetical protein